MGGRRVIISVRVFYLGFRGRVVSDLEYVQGVHEDVLVTGVLYKVHTVAPYTLLLGKALQDFV